MGESTLAVLAPGSLAGLNMAVTLLGCGLRLWTWVSVITIASRELLYNVIDISVDL